MKLASLKSGRDGRLVIVSRDLSRAVLASSIAPTMQAALDDWPGIAPALAARAEKLEARLITAFPFREDACAAPLPRAYQWADGSAYVNHAALVRKARDAEIPASFWTDPLIYQGGSDCFLGPRDPIPLPGDESLGLDLEAEVAAVTDDVPMGTTPEAARAHVRLVMLANDVTLRRLVASEVAKGFGFFQSKPASAFSPVFVTPDALGAWWQGGKLHRRLMVDLNGKPFGRADAAVDMTFDFGMLIAHAAKTRNLAAGTIIGSGTVSNRDAGGGPGKPIAEGGVGYSCIAEQRTIETIARGAAETPFLKSGDTVRIWVEDDRHHPIFGVIEQTMG